MRPTRACYMCLKTAILCESHLLPKALYRFCMARGDKNPHPVVVLPNFQKQVALQLKRYLFCELCEQRLRANGEDWVLRYCCRGLKGPFALRNILLNNKPTVATNE